MKKLVCTLLALAMALGLAACGGNSGSSGNSGNSGSSGSLTGEVYELKVSTTQTQTSMIYKGLQAAAEKIAADTDGHVKVTIYDSSSLGAEEDMIDQALQGMGIAGTYGCGPYVQLCQRHGHYEHGLFCGQL